MVECKFRTGVNGDRCCCKNPMFSWKGEFDIEFCNSCPIPNGSYPTILDMAKNLTKEVSSHIKNGLEICSEEEASKRLEICKKCDHFDNGRCRLCGCFLNVKAEWKSSKCPAGKW